MQTIPAAIQHRIAIVLLSIASLSSIAGCGTGMKTASGSPSPTSPSAYVPPPVPSAVAYNASSNTYYVPTGYASTLSVYDGNSNASVATVTVSGGLLNEVVINPTTNMVYTAGSESAGDLFVIDGATNTVAGDLGPAGAVSKIAINAATNAVYTLSPKGYFINGNSTLLVFNGTTKTLSATLLLPAYATGLAVNSRSNLLYVTTYKGVSVIDGTTNKVVATVPSALGILDESTDIALDQNTNTVFVANGDGTGNGLATADTVSLIDGASNSVKANVSVGTAIYPSKIAVNPTTGMVYALNLSSNSLSVISEASASVVATVALPALNPGLAFPSNDGDISVNIAKNLIYIATGQSLILIDGATNTIVSQ